jgi:DNA polymerase-3 subunit gamma/tau
LRRLWPEILEVVKQGSRRTRALLDNAQIVDVAGELITLAAPAALAKMIGEDSNTAGLRAALTRVVGGQWQIDVTAAAAQPSTTDRPADEPDPRDDVPEAPSAPGAPARTPADPEAEALRLLRERLDARPLEP